MNQYRRRARRERRHLVILMLLAVSLLWTGMSADAVSADATAPYDLAVSDRSDRSDPRLLEGESFDPSATIYVFMQPGDGVVRVRFYLDDPAMSGEPWRVERIAPYDFNSTADDGTAEAFRLDSISTGTHTITAAAERVGAPAKVTSATFTVRRPPYTLAVSALPDRFDPEPLAGATYERTDKIFVFIQPGTGIMRVRFYLDDPAMSRAPHTTENLPQYDFNRTAGDGRAIPFDLSTLPVGRHTITAAVEPTGLNARTEVVSATFEVAASAGGDGAQGTLAFEDSFDGSTLNTESWDPYYSPGHAGHGLRRPSAIALDGNGNLVLTARMVDGKVVSGGMAHRQNFTYGRFEVRVRTEPDPAGTMNGVVLTWPQSGNWPADGENNIYETGWEFDTRTPFYSFVHYDATNKQAYHVHQADASQWHVMAMDWSPEAIKIYRDGVHVWTVDDPVIIPDVAHHLTIQLDAMTSRALTAPVRMYVDYVRIYRHR